MAFISSCCQGERCFCGLSAAHKIEETIFFDDPAPDRHPLTTYVCHACFRVIMGPMGRRGVALMFKLRRPCENCPFRKGIGPRFRLSPSRLHEIRRGTAFQCHKTVDYDHWPDPVKRSGDRPRQCAGLMAVLHRENDPNQIMQVAQRLGHLDPAALDPDHEAYANWRSVVRAHCS